MNGELDPPYTGPPPMAAPPEDWRPSVHYQAPPPRDLPTQDHDAINVREDQARMVSYGLAIAGAVVIGLMMFVLCARWVLG